MTKFIALIITVFSCSLSAQNTIGIYQDNPVSTLDIYGEIIVGRSYSGLSSPPQNGAILEGSVGIGTATPVNKLDIEGNLAIGSSYSGTSSAPVDGAIIEGWVGIGLTNPSVMLGIGNGLAGGFRSWQERGIQIAWDSDNVYFGLKDEGSDLKEPVICWGDNNNESLRFMTTTSGSAAPYDEWMRITGIGNVGIGTQFPGYLLHVNGSAAKPGGGSWTAASDVRLKQEVRNYLPGLQEVLTIQPVIYQYTKASEIGSEGQEYVGVIAQEIQKILPESVGSFVGKDGLKYLSFDPSELNYLLINAVKELADQNRRLEEKLNRQEVLIQDICDMQIAQVESL